MTTEPYRWRFWVYAFFAALAVGIAIFSGGCGGIELQEALTVSQDAGAGIDVGPLDHGSEDRNALSAPETQPPIDAGPNCVDVCAAFCAPPHPDAIGCICRCGQ